MGFFSRGERLNGVYLLRNFWQKKTLFLVAAGLAVFLSVISITFSTTSVRLAGFTNLQAWVMPGLLRVSQTEFPGTRSSANLFSARGETVDTQVIVRASDEKLTNVNLTASALVGPGGASIPASSITLYREHYVTVTGTASYGGGTNPPLGSGTYPEPLVPFNDPESGAPLCGSSSTLKACNATVNAGHNQPYWIDISVPRGATNSPPGIYTGAISITADQGSTSIPLKLTLWNFELPLQPSEASLWSLWPPSPGNTDASLARALMRDKVMSWYDAPEDAASDIASFGLSRSALNFFFHITIQCNGSYANLPSAAQLSASEAKLPRNLHLDFYVGEEIDGCVKAYPALKAVGLVAHASSPAAETIATFNAPDPKLFNEGDGRSAIDHWVLLDSMQQWPALPFTGGGDLWSYTSCNSGSGNTPEWMIDYPPINERIQAGFLNWTQGATGILYYRSDGWTSGNTLKSWNSVDMLDCGGFSRPGDGIFLYPPGPIGSTESAPGIRLKAIRDGLQDYEYAQILKKLGKSQFLASTTKPVAASWTNWTQDPNALENVRLQLGQEIHQLSAP